MTDTEQDAADLPGKFRQQAGPVVLSERVTVDLDIDALAWLRAAHPDWQEQLNAMLCYFHERASSSRRRSTPTASSRAS